MLTNLLEQLSVLLAEQGDLNGEMKKLKEQNDILQAKIDQIKEILIKELPTDVYSTEEFTLSKKKDFEMEIKVEDLAEYYKKSQPDRARIREALLFGMEVAGVQARPITALNIRRKKNVQEN